jgi:hypothetical protein
MMEEPYRLNEFQQEMYRHLIGWKNNRSLGTDNDTPWLTKQTDFRYPHIYPSILDRLMEHQKNHFFKFQRFVSHMASSQIACFNLFLPFLCYPEAANDILRNINDALKFKRLATEYLDKGFRFEFWDEDKSNPRYKGLLNDHTRVAGTDSDIAIAYYDTEDNPCLWLIEHKLTEKEFTTCGGAKSKGRKSQHSCDSIDAVLKNLDTCYYHSQCRYEYWNVTKRNSGFFKEKNLLKFYGCPFKYGMNQLWRNQLLGLAIERSEELPYKKVFFSVVHHPKNHYLDETIRQYRQLIDNNEKFFSFKSNEIIDSAKNSGDSKLTDWVDWYENLYLKV